VQLFNSSSRVTSQPATPKSPARDPQGLHLLLKRDRAEVSVNGPGSVIAFTSANQGEGVSHVVQFFAKKLAVQTSRRTVVVDATRLGGLQVADFVTMPGRFWQTSVANLWLLSNDPLEEDPTRALNQEGSWQDDAEWRLDPLQALASTFSYTLIDCPSLQASSEVEMLAPDVDGIVLVVEADRTKRDQILRARRTIEMANGKLMALVLNKRRHVVPDWIYRRL
jgi:protein-tyrosine kinase